MSFYKIIAGIDIVVVDLIDHIKKISFDKVCDELDAGHIRIVSEGKYIFDEKKKKYVSGQYIDLAGESMHPKSIAFNGYQNIEYTIISIDDKHRFHGSLEKWKSMARNPGFKMGELAPVLKEVKESIPKIRQDKGWIVVEHSVNCANCGIEIKGTKRVRGNQAQKFIPNIKTVTNVGRNWYCTGMDDACTTISQFEKVVLVKGRQIPKKEALWPRFGGGKNVGATITVTFNGSDVDSVKKLILEWADVLNK